MAGFSKMIFAALHRKVQNCSEGNLSRARLRLSDVGASSLWRGGVMPRLAAPPCFSGHPGHPLNHERPNLYAHEKESCQQTRSDRAHQRRQTLRPTQRRRNIWKNCGSRQVIVRGLKDEGEENGPEGPGGPRRHKEEKVTATTRAIMRVYQAG